ncbi:hypothetical protein [Acuticoccus yangtzensis]|uniref:hypothetical protein n=1 Tax=Acuticoccus yangtzensis TaxID=1443441 RepID=UPI0009498C90|nr:hypothetical protein [Acuticoccus yangtzensis]
MDQTRLIFHLGMPKTGTSILQNSVTRALRETGPRLMVPAFGRGMGIAHHALVRRVAEAEPGSTLPIAAELSREIAAHRAEQMARTQQTTRPEKTRADGTRPEKTQPEKMAEQAATLEKGAAQEGDVQEGGAQESAAPEADLSGAGPESGAGHPLTVFVSSEGFTNLCGVKRADHLADFIDAFEGVSVEVLVVIRELSDFLESMYLQSARFGHMKGTFADYLTSRRRWVRDYFRGLLVLRARLGERLDIVFQAPGFDILTHANALLRLEEGTLTRASRTVRSTAKRELKEQVALSFLAETEAAAGFKISRDKLMRVFDDRPDVFAGRVERYTLYGPEARQATYDDLIAAAAETGFTAYLDAFGGGLKRRDVPVFPFTFDQLGAADIAAIAALRPQIEATPR